MLISLLKGPLDHRTTPAFLNHQYLVTRGKIPRVGLSAKWHKLEKEHLVKFKMKIQAW